MKPSDTVLHSMTKIHGVGRVRALQICREWGRSPQTTMAERAQGDLLKPLESWLEQEWRIDANRRRYEQERIQRHRGVGSNRGIRMRQGRPVRGQRTATNARTAKRLNGRRRS